MSIFETSLCKPCKGTGSISSYKYDDSQLTASYRCVQCDGKGYITPTDKEKHRLWLEERKRR